MWDASLSSNLVVKISKWMVMERITLYFIVSFEHVSEIDAWTNWEIDVIVIDLLEEWLLLTKKLTNV